jgi:hypothetical protein
VNAWTSAADIRARIRRKWDDGTLPRAYAAGLPCPVLEVAVRGPKPGEIGEDVTAVRSWIADLDAGRRCDQRYRLLYRAVGGRLIGRNEVPSRAIVDTYEQAWALLGVSREVAALDRVLELTDDPRARGWVLERPLKAVALVDEWPQVLAAVRWLDSARGSGVYLRQISAPGVDTKFIERHRSVLAAMLGVSTSSAGFLSQLGLAAKPELVRLRGWGPVSEVTLRLTDLASLDLDPATVLIVENEITFLSVALPARGLVIWGRGFDVGRLAALPWLKSARVFYWGDLDTHGFAILNQARSVVPGTRSILMDRDTLLTHRDRWVTEPVPTTARLDRLDGDEREVYEALVTDEFGARVRLEQERIDWAWVVDRLPR